MYTNPEGYDRFMGRWSARLAPEFIRFAGLGDADLILDLGCGTGCLARAVPAACGRARVVGVDPAWSYLEYARRRVPRGRTSLVAALAESLPFPDGGFDAVLSLLVLQEFPDPERAVAEMCRVARPGGIVAACQWDFGHGMPMLAAIWEAVRDVAPEVCDGRKRASESEEDLRALWTSAGLVDVATDGLPMELSFANLDDLWGPVLTGPTPTSALVASLAPAAREAIRARLATLVLRGEPDGAFTMRARAFAVRGRRPDA